MEIERLVSGDLNKSIEQCVTLLMDVERKVHVLKTELAQTLHQLPRTAGAYGATGSFPLSPGFASPVAPPYAAPAAVPSGFDAGLPRPTAPAFAPSWAGWTGWSPGWASVPWTYGYPVNRENLPSTFGFPGHQGIPLPNLGVPYGSPYGSPYGIPYHGAGVPNMPAYSPLHPGVPPVSGYGYIW